MNFTRLLLLAATMWAATPWAYTAGNEAEQLKTQMSLLPEVPKDTGPIGQKIATHLRQVLDQVSASGPVVRASAFSNSLVRLNDAGEVQVYVRVASLSDTTLEALKARGLRVEIADSQTNTVQGWLPVAAVAKVAAMPSAVEIRPPSYRQMRAGSVMTQGDAIHRANVVRAAGIFGRGAKVGVISDGVDNRAVSQATLDLPPTFNIDPAFPGTGDYGTALLEIIHDLAPMAELAFSGPQTSLEFPRALRFLVKTAGCHIVMDDVGFYDEPYFEDGPVALAVAQAITSGVLYISACGNDAQRHYQSDYVDWNPSATSWPNDCHAFAPGDPDMDISIPANREIAVFLQWAEPFGKAASDYDVFLYNDALTTALTWSNAVQNGNDNPYEAFVYRNNSATAINARIIVNRAAGTPKTLEMFFWTATPKEYLISTDSVFGHPAVNGVLSVGAIHQDDQGWDTVASFSSLGRSTIRFPSAAQRNTPRVVAIDGVSVTGAGAPANVYFGTSAAAAHAAGIAALVKSSSPTMTRAQILNRLETGVVDIGAPGYDVVSGLGRLDAQLAVRVFPSTPARHWELYP